MTNGWRCASRCRFPGIPESVLLDFFDAEPLHVRLTEAEELDEVGAIHIAYKLSLDGMLPTHLLGDFAQLLHIPEHVRSAGDVEIVHL